MWTATTYYFWKAFGIIFFDLIAQDHWVEFTQVNSHWMALGLFQSLCIALTSGIRFSSNTLSRWLYHLMKYNGPGVRRGIPVPVLPQISCLDLGRLHGFTGFPCGSKGKESAHHVGDLSSNPGSGSSTGEENGNSSILAWKIPWTEKCGGLRSIGSWRVGHDGVSLLSHGFTGLF